MRSYVLSSWGRKAGQYRKPLAQTWLLQAPQPHHPTLQVQSKASQTVASPKTTAPWWIFLQVPSSTETLTQWRNETSCGAGRCRWGEISHPWFARCCQVSSWVKHCVTDLKSWSSPWFMFWHASPVLLSRTRWIIDLFQYNNFYVCSWPWKNLCKIWTYILLAQCSALNTEFYSSCALPLLLSMSACLKKNLEKILIF